MHNVFNKFSFNVCSLSLNYQRSSFMIIIKKNVVQEILSLKKVIKNLTRIDNLTLVAFTHYFIFFKDN